MDPLGSVPEFRRWETRCASFWNIAYVSAVFFVSRVWLREFLWFVERFVFSNDEVRVLMFELGSFSRECLEIFFGWFGEIDFGICFGGGVGRAFGVFAIRFDGDSPIVCVFDMLAKIYGINGRHR